MRTWWIKFGCFLTGYNYNILSSCSEASVKMVQKITSALLIVTIMWAFIGYSFAEKYLGLSSFGSIGVAALMVTIVIQIERQIILSFGKIGMAKGLRIFIGIIMAVLGSVIIDQILFKDDIEKQKILKLDEEMETILPKKLAEINFQLADLDSSLKIKEDERMALVAEITKKPTIQMPTYTTKKIPRRIKVTQIVDGEEKIIEKDSLFIEREYVSKAAQNPKAAFIPQIDAQIEKLQNQKNILFNQKTNIRNQLEKELMSKVGFLDELNVLFQILTSSWVSGCIWAGLFLFFALIETFVLVSKWSDQETDYDQIILHQMRIRKEALKNLQR